MILFSPAFMAILASQIATRNALAVTTASSRLRRVTSYPVGAFYASALAGKEKSEEPIRVDSSTWTGRKA